MFTYPTRSSFVAFGGNRTTDHKERSFLLHLLWAESSAVDKFNDTSVFSQLSGLRYSVISGQIYNRTVQALSRRFSHRNLFKFHYGHCYGWPISNGKIAINVEKYEKVNMNEGQLVLNSFKLVVTIMIWLNNFFYFCFVQCLVRCIWNLIFMWNVKVSHSSTRSRQWKPILW